MELVEPIRDTKKIDRMKKYLKEKRPADIRPAQSTGQGRSRG